MHFSDFFEEIEHLSGKIGGLRSVLVVKQKHNVQKPGFLVTLSFSKIKKKNNQSF